MIATGLDRLLAEPRALAGRRFALLSHAAAVSAELVPIHLALAAAGAGSAALLLAPEHGFFAVEQDMAPVVERRDPFTGVPVLSLYGLSVESLKPPPAAFDGLDLLLVDLQDVGCRYYTYAATAVWAAQAALAAGLEVWVLDRPNPLGGERVEGNLPRSGHESFVGAFALPVRHGLTLGELMLLEARRRRWPQPPRVWPLAGWRREMGWEEIERPWIAPSPNLPTAATTWVYPGACLIEATRLSEGRGTARPFLLVGAPGVDPRAVAGRLAAVGLTGIRFLPTYFRPQFQKHAGQVCGGVELVPVERRRLPGYRLGIELLRAFHDAAPEAFGWRQAPYEFVADRPAIDLLVGDAACRLALAGEGDLDAWIAGWAADEAAFRAERAAVLLYP